MDAQKLFGAAEQFNYESLGPKIQHVFRVSFSRSYWGGRFKNVVVLLYGFVIEVTLSAGGGQKLHVFNRIFFHGKIRDPHIGKTLYQMCSCLETDPVSFHKRVLFHIPQTGRFLG